MLSLILAATLAGTPPIAIVLRVDGRQDAPYVRFLCEQAEQRWGVIVERGDAQPSGFFIHIEELAAGQLAVRIARDGELLTDRALDAADPTQAQLSLWLLVRSTVERGLTQAVIEDEAPARVDGAASVEAQAPPPSAEVDPERGWRASRGVLATLWLETPKLLAAGIAVTGTLDSDLFIAGASFGYRQAPAPDGLTVHAAPLTFIAGLRAEGRAFTASLGLLGAAELKMAMSGERVAFVPGVEGGPFGQARIPLDAEIGVVLRFAVAWRLVRQRYLFDGNRVEEHLWTATLSTGVDWR